MANEHCDLTIKEAVSAIAGKKLKVQELVESCLERILLLDNKIQAWVAVSAEAAVETARLLDAELAQGKPPRPLHGIPFGIKDIFYATGFLLKAGSKSWQGITPSFDATAVARLKAAGAVILGKTQTTEFAYLDPAPTHNPWNLEHTPGGSSAGSAAGLAAGMCLGALGSQTVGSTGRPAAYNGLVGFKPQWGRISVYGAIPLAWNLDHVGILTHTVEDAAMVFQTIAGYDPQDAHCLDEPVPDCLINLKKTNKPRLGIVRKHFYNLADEEMRNHTDEIAECFRQAGAQVEEIEPSFDFAEVMNNGRLIVAVEAAAYHQEMFVNKHYEYQPGIGKLIEEGLSISATGYARMLEARLKHSSAIKSLFQSVDALLTPGAVGAAPHGLSSTGSSAMQGPWTVVGFPTIGLPSGLNKGGLPLAVQLVGRPKSEDHLLAVAQWCEGVLNFNRHPPIIQQ